MARKPVYGHHKASNQARQRSGENVFPGENRSPELPQKFAESILNNLFQPTRSEFKVGQRGATWQVKSESRQTTRCIEYLAATV